MLSEFKQHLQYRHESRHYGEDPGEISEEAVKALRKAMKENEK